MKTILIAVALLIPCQLWAMDWEIKEGTSYCVERNGYIADCFDTKDKAQEMVDIMNEAPPDHQEPPEPKVDTDVTPPMPDSNKQGDDRIHCYNSDDIEVPCH